VRRQRICPPTPNGRTVGGTDVPALEARCGGESHRDLRAALGEAGSSRDAGGAGPGIMHRHV
jgi:hypothetical protein